MNKELYEEAKQYIPGGVNSPVRAFKAVGGEPVFIERAKGSKLYDTGGKEYIDYCLSWGALILGHSYPEIIEETKKVIEKGISFGAPTQAETELAKEICKAIPSVELVRLVNSGTEAVMSAIRLARGYTGRDKVIKFAGSYHGHAGYLLVSAGSGGATFGIPDSQGVPEDFIRHTIVLPYNNLNAVEEAVRRSPSGIACIIVEPVAGNMGVVLPERGFLGGLREICNEFGSVLIFDEVITGFRLSLGGAQQIFGISPDLTCLGKIVGGGLPIGAYGGRREIMECVSPLGKVYQAGTLSGNPVAVGAGLATLKFLYENNIYESLELRTKQLCEGIEDVAKERGVKIRINKIGSMFTIFFTYEEVVDFQSAKKTDIESYSRFFHGMLKEGVYLPPSNFESCFSSLSHSVEDVKQTIRASRASL